MPGDSIFLQRLSYFNNEDSKSSGFAPQRFHAQIPAQPLACFMPALIFGIVGSVDYRTFSNPPRRYAACGIDLHPGRLRCHQPPAVTVVCFVEMLTPGFPE